MPKYNWKHLVATATCCVGIAAAILTLNRLQGRDTVEVVRQIDTDVVSRSAGFVDLDDVGTSGLVTMVTETLLLRAAETSLPDGDSLAVDASTILHAWLGGTGDDYLAYLDACGDTPPPAAVWDDPKQRNDAWLNSTQDLREASFNPDGVIIRTSCRNGVPIPDDASKKSVTGWRFDKLSGFDNAYPTPEEIQAMNVEMHEVRIPMRSRGILNNTDYVGFLVLSYISDQVTSRWTLVAVSVYDVPSGDTVRTPPF